MKQIIDLTYGMEEGMTSYYPAWHTVFEMTQLGRHGIEGRETRRIVCGTHTGTHIDAPLHLVKNGGTIDQLPLDKLMGEVTIVDFSHLKECTEITKEMLAKVKVTKRMIFKFSWTKYWCTQKFYSAVPFFSKEAAQYLVDNGMELIALDTPSPDDGRTKLPYEELGSEKDSPIHKLFLRNKVILIEYLTNLEKVKDYEGWSIAALPLKIIGADGAPTRVCIFK
ncbi:cyclase family protein [Candidatus Woesearchaeota archaeon]|nr:cyclase family protein [Candidatus Woesearchaeota archaeon]